MTAYEPPVKDYDFLLRNVIATDEVLSAVTAGDVSVDDAMDVVEGASSVVRPIAELSAIGDRIGVASPRPTRGGCGPRAPDQRARGGLVGLSGRPEPAARARALGLGAVITIWHLFLEHEWKRELGIPQGINTFAVIPVGWPRGRFGPVARRPAAELIHRDRW